MWECVGYGPATNRVAVQDRGKGWSKLPTSTQRRDVFRGKDCGVVHSQYNTTAQLWKGLPGDTRARQITNFGLEPKHSKINTWQASGFERSKYFGEVGPSYVSDLRRKRPEELALSPRTMGSEAILERDEWWDVDPRSNRFTSKVVPVPGSKGAPKIDKRKLPKAYVPDPVESERAYRGIGRKESTHCVGDDIFRVSREEVDDAVEEWLRSHNRPGYVRPYRTVRARSSKPVDWSDMEDLVFALRALPEQPEEQTSKRDDLLVERMLGTLNMIG